MDWSQVDINNAYAFVFSIFICACIFLAFTWIFALIFEVDVRRLAVCKIILILVFAVAISAKVDSVSKFCYKACIKQTVNKDILIKEYKKDPAEFESLVETIYDEER